MSNTRIEVPSDHWYTPADIMERVDRTFRRPYWDPCTSPGVSSGPYIEPMVSGDFLGETRLQLETVFMNPPYSKAVGGAGAFTDHLLYLNPTSAIVVVNASTSTKWWQRLAFASLAICFVSPRIRFDRVIDGKRVPGDSPRYSNCIHLIGDAQDNIDVGAFKREFDDLGVIL